MTHPLVFDVACQRPQGRFCFLLAHPVFPEKFFSPAAHGRMLREGEWAKQLPSKFKILLEVIASLDYDCGNSQSFHENKIALRV